MKFISFSLLLLFPLLAVTFDISFLATNCLPEGQSCNDSRNDQCCNRLVCRNGRLGAHCIKPECFMIGDECESSNECCGETVCTNNLCQMPSCLQAGSNCGSVSIPCCGNLECNREIGQCQ